MGIGERSRAVPTLADARRAHGAIAAERVRDAAYEIHPVTNVIAEYCDLPFCDAAAHVRYEASRTASDAGGSAATWNALPGPGSTPRSDVSS